MTTGKAAPPQRRDYHSPLRQSRAEQTRAAVLGAATRLFVERGWSGTGMRDVAAEAGVAVETIYAAIGTKADLLKQALDVAIVGDDESVALTERPEFRALAQGSLAERSAAAAALVAAVNERTAGLLRTLREAAGCDPALAARLEETRAGHRATVRVGGPMIAGRAMDEDELDGLWAILSAEVFELLTGSAGWSTEQYRRWLGSVIEDIHTTRAKRPPR